MSKKETKINNLPIGVHGCFVAFYKHVPNQRDIVIGDIAEETVYEIAAFYDMPVKQDESGIWIEFPKARDGSKLVVYGE